MPRQFTSYSGTVLGFFWLAVSVHTRLPWLVASRWTGALFWQKIPGYADCLCCAGAEAAQGAEVEG